MKNKNEPDADRNSAGSLFKDNFILIKWIFIIVVLLSELFLYTWCRVSYTEIGFRISQQKDKQKALRGYTDALSMENDRLLSPERIAYIASTRLNLIIPEPNQVIYIDNM